MADHAKWYAIKKCAIKVQAKCKLLASISSTTWQVREGGQQGSDHLPYNNSLETKTCDPRSLAREAFYQCFVVIVTAQKVSSLVRSVES